MTDISDMIVAVEVWQLRERVKHLSADVERLARENDKLRAVNANNHINNLHELMRESEEIRVLRARLAKYEALEQWQEMNKESI